MQSVCWRLAAAGLLGLLFSPRTSLRLIFHASTTQKIKNLELLKRDFFDVGQYEAKFDFVYSHGVVEHFADLKEVLKAHSLYLSNDGHMLTTIPNLSGILGTLTRILNRRIYDMHVPHDLRSFLQGHEAAGLEVLDYGYLCSNNFGVLGSCVTKKPGAVWATYASLSLISLLTWHLEDRVHELPTSKTFSPYIFVLSKK